MGGDLCHPVPPSFRLLISAPPSGGLSDTRRSPNSGGISSHLEVLLDELQIVSGEWGVRVSLLDLLASDLE